MGASITLAGESLIAQKQGAQQILTVSRFILANVPGLDPNGPVDRAAGKPTAGQIVGSYDVTQAGYVNPNQVVYSLMMGSDIGDFDWNWIGLETADNVLLMVAHVPTQQKRRNIPPLQLGNNVTRNFLVVFDGAQALTGLTIDASTWQHDFTVRLAGIDERERQSNRDIFGRACFFGSALQLEKVGAVYQLKPGTAYVEGVRLQRSAALPVVPPAFPTTAWLDVALQRELSDVVASWSVVWGAGKVDYVDSAGVQHYCVAIADLPNSNIITDRRPVEDIAGPLVAHFAARVGDYAGLRARSTTKDDVGLGNLPNAKSDDENTDSSVILATTKAVKAASALLWTAIANIVSGATTVGKAAKLATARTISLTGDVTGSVSFDGSANAAIAATGVQAAKLKAARTISLTGDVTGSVNFDGSANVNMSATVQDDSHNHVISNVDGLQVCIATAWVNFNGTGTVAIRDSFNVSSITDNGTGQYTVNFATPMNHENYAAFPGAGQLSTQYGAFIRSASIGGTPITKTVNAISVGHRADTTWDDPTDMYVVIFGGR